MFGFGTRFICIVFTACQHYHLSVRLLRFFFAGDFQFHNSTVPSDISTLACSLKDCIEHLRGLVPMTAY